MRKLFLIAAACCAFAHAEDMPAPTVDDAFKREVLQHLAHDVMQPLAAGFAEAGSKLAAASHAYCDGSGDVRALQAAWRSTQAAWQPLEALQIGPTIERRTQRQVNAWPVRVKLLEKLLEENPITPEHLEVQGAAGKGLPALEYVLFGEDKPRCDLVRALSGQVQSEAQGLANDWEDYAKQMAEAGLHPDEGIFASADQGIGDVMNLLIAGIDAIKIRKLEKPLEKSSGGPDGEVSLDRIESWRSENTWENIRNNLRGFELAFFGAGDNGVAIDDYLAKIERPGLARVIRNELDKVKAALAKMRSPMQAALKLQRKEVEALHKAVSYLQYLLETEVAEALAVDLSFNANDGD